MYIESTLIIKFSNQKFKIIKLFLYGIGKKFLKKIKMKNEGF